ncbi:flagellar motor switch protein FliG [Nitrospira defluvii]|nr:flagellar motor switch protein FliG [Nitrospira defluvii]
MAITDGYYKAAVLLMTLGEDAASEVMKTLSPKALNSLGVKITELTDIPQTDLDEILNEFSDHVGESGGMTVAGKDYIEKVLNKALGPEKAGRVMENLVETEESGLENLKWMDPRGIASLIRGEHPQTIALILSYLDSTQVSEILPFLPEALKGDVMFRMATLEDIPPGVMQEIGAALQRDLSQSDAGSAGASRKVSGIRMVADILNQVDSASEKEIMASISENHVDVADQIRQLMFIFDDLGKLDNRAMQELLKVVSKEQLILALKATNDELKELIFSNMSERAALLLKEDFEAKGPVKVSEVEKAQQEILKLAKVLEEAGTISIGGKGDSEALI